MKEQNGIAVPSTATQANSISERKREANRKNAQRSTGPKTEVGKSRSRWNAITHGFFVREMPLQGFLFIEDFGKARRLFQELFDHFQPVGPIEKLHVERIAVCYWKMRRFQIAENASIKVEMLHEAEMFRITRGKSRSLLVLIAFGDAKKKAGELGYVDDALVKTILEFHAEHWLQDNFVLANQKARDLAIQPDDGSNLDRHQAVKKARLALRRRLHALEERCMENAEHADDFESRRHEPYYAQHLLPDFTFLDNLLRYQGAVERQLYRAFAELERLQRQRLGHAVPDHPKLTM
jgi:hypothetical protein